MRRGRFGPGPRSPSLRLPSRLFLAALTVVLLVPTGGLASISAGGTALAPSLGHLGGPLGGPGPDRTGSPSAAGLTSEAGAVAMGPARPGVLVTSTIDLLANRVLSGNSPLRYANTVSGIAFDPTEDLLFVSGATSNSVVAMNVATGVVETAAGPLPTGNASYVDAAPASLAFDAVDNQLFASDPTLDQIEIFNVSATAPSFSYYETIQMALGTHPEGLLALSSPDRVFVADENLDQVTAIDPTNDTYAGNVSVGGGPVALAYDASVGFVYVADSATADMSWFGAVGLAPGASKFPVKNGPTSIALDPSTDTIWVANAATITIVQSATRAASINITLPSPTRISGLLWDPIVGEMLASNSPTGAVSYIASNGTVTGNVSTGGSPGAMVENTISQEVDLIDPASNDLVRISDLSESVVGTEWAGVSPGISTLNPITDRIEVPDTTSNRIVEIAAKSVALGDTPRVRTVPVPGHPVATTFDPVAGLLVVALSDGTVVGLNATSGAIERSDNLGSSNPLFDVLFADGQVFACGGSNLLWSLDPRSLNGVATVPLTSLSSSPRQMAYDPATKLLYVTLAQANKVAVVNASQDVSDGTIAGGTNPYGIAFDPTSGNLFVADTGTDTLDVIHAASGTSVTTVPVGTSPRSVLYVAATQTVYETDSRSDTVTILNANSFGVVSVVPVGDDPDGLAFANITGDVFVSDVPDSALSVIVAASAGPVPFAARLSVAPTLSDVGTTVVYTATASYPSWGFSYAYSGLPGGCTTANTSVLRCATSGASGPVNATVLVTSVGGDSVSANTSLDLVPGVSITAFTLSRAAVTIGIPVVFNVTAQGGLPPYTYSYTSLPPGCSTETVARFTCTPSRAGSYESMALVVDHALLPATSTANLTVNSLIVSNPAISSSSISEGQTVEIWANATQGTAPYTFRYSGLPAGCLTSNASSIRCTPTETGNFSIQVLIVDASGSPLTRTLSLVVNPAPAPSSGTPTLDLLLIGAAVAVAAVLAVLFFRRKGPAAAGPGEGATEGQGPGPEVYTASSRSVPRLPVGPADAHGPEAEPVAQRLYVPSPEDAEAATVSASPAPTAGAARPNLVCPSCGTVNEPWLTYCRSCKRPLLTT